MIVIKKSTPPKELLEKQCKALEKQTEIIKEQRKALEEQCEIVPKVWTSEDSYNLLDRRSKQKVLESLIKEQGGLCAYCMRRIPDERKPADGKPYDPVTIEHWKPLNPPALTNKRDDGRGLDYNNLLAVCTGNRRSATKKKRKQGTFTCDAKRGSAPLKVNPCDPSTLAEIQYSSKGEISSTDPIIDKDLKERLGLNCSVDVLDLPKLRKGALDGLFKHLEKTLDSTSTEDFRKYCIFILEVLENETGLKAPYVGIVLWRIREFLKNTEG